MKKLLLIDAFAALLAISSATVMSESLAAHNKYRTALGLPSLTWSTTLASSAQTWANNLAKTRKLTHSTNRKNVGENLAYGSTKTTVTNFVSVWAAEKDDFVAGKNYPKCTSTGDVADVWHYTQIVWANTTKVGCGLTSSSGRTYYVCQYSPAGNINGQAVYTVGVKANTTKPTNTTGSTSSTNTTKPTNSTGSTNSTSTTNTTKPANTTTSTNSTSTTNSTSSTGTQNSSFITDSLAAHNNERAAYGVSLLTWSTTLAQSAQTWADHIASTGVASHSTNRVNVGENLAWGSGSKVGVTFFVGLWLAEKEYFIAGEDFPNCSTTGSWSDVAHYTQLMWAKTTEVGCGMTKASSGTYYYVCQYSPQGNINGKPVY